MKKLQEKEEKGRKPMTIEGPMNVTHVSHLGWDPVNGFQMRNIPPEWRSIFAKAGVRKSDLANPETAAFIMTTISTTLGPQSALPAKVPPSPLGGITTGQARAPPSSLIPGSASTGRIPPPPISNARAPPPPPMPSGRVPPSLVPTNDDEETEISGGSGLLSAIQGTLLKRVDVAASPLPDIDAQQEQTLLGVLSQAMADRRVNINEDEEGSSDDDWSDEDWDP